MGFLSLPSLDRGRFGVDMANIEAEDEAGHHRLAADFFHEQKLQDPMIRADVTMALQEPADVILSNIDSKASSNDRGN